MDELTLQLTPAMLALVPIVGAIVQLLKRVKVVEKNIKLLPFVSILVALGIAYAMKLEEPVVASVVIGLVASGGYDLVTGAVK